MAVFPRRQATRSAWHSEAGVTAIEYGLILALVAMGIVVALTLFSTNMSAMFTSVASKLHM
jgi:pilus assembly protein Flp/PilA